MTKPFLEDRRRLIDALDLARQPPGRLKAMLSKAMRLGARIRMTGPAEQRALLLEVVRRIEVHRDRLSITLLAESLNALIGQGSNRERTSDFGTISLDLPVRFRRRGAEMKLILAEDGARSPNPDTKLIAAVARGHCWFEELRTGAAPSVQALVDRHGVDQGDVSRILPLAFLAPDIVEAILQGRQPVELTAARLKRIGLPLCWAEQRRALGFAD